MRDEEEMLIDLGPCCVCGKTGPAVRNILMLHKKCLIPGHGWGCFQCGLPSDDASAVVCDECLDLPLYACRGYPGTEGRVPIEKLSPEPFDHRRELHPELWGDQN